MTETLNFKNSFLFENLMKRFDQSCEHLDLQIGKLNQKKRKAEENKNLDPIPTQTHPYHDLQKNNNKTGDQSFDNVTVIEDTTENSTLDTKKRKIDEEELIISNATTNQSGRGWHGQLRSSEVAPLKIIMDNFGPLGGSASCCTNYFIRS